MTETDDRTTLEAWLGFTFRNPDLLDRALRHRSVAMHNPQESYERLEFLGDSIVGMVVCDSLCARFPEASEGELATAKGYLVSEPVLAEAGLTLGLNEAVALSPSEEAYGGRNRRSIISDTFEAVVAAVYMDRGLRAARRVVNRALRPAMLRVDGGNYRQDFKSLLQERLQARSRKSPEYTISEETGAEHDKTFVAHVFAATRKIGEGAGKSKKEAEQAAARAALDTMG